MKLTKSKARRRRHLRVRQIVSGDAQRPRICVHRSNRHIAGQLIDDQTGRTLASVTTVSKDASGKNNRNKARAAEVGKALGEKMKSLGITSAVFDRGGHIYHGVVKAFADGIRSIDEESHFNF